MTPDPFWVSVLSAITEAAWVLARRKLGCALVVEDGRVVGIFTTTDALRALVEHGGARAETSSAGALP
jgi:CBS domain-containing protein